MLFPGDGVVVAVESLLGFAADKADPGVETALALAELEDAAAGDMGAGHPLHSEVIIYGVATAVAAINVEHGTVAEHIVAVVVVSVDDSFHIAHLEELRQQAAVDTGRAARLAVVANQFAAGCDTLWHFAQGNMEKRHRGNRSTTVRGSKTFAVCAIPIELTAPDIIVRKLILLSFDSDGVAGIKKVEHPFRLVAAQGNDIVGAAVDTIFGRQVEAALHFTDIRK